MSTPITAKVRIRQADIGAAVRMSASTVHGYGSPTFMSGIHCESVHDAIDVGVSWIRTNTKLRHGLIHIIDQTRPTWRESYVSVEMGLTSDPLTWSDYQE